VFPRARLAPQETTNKNKNNAQKRAEPCVVVCETAGHSAAWWLIFAEYSSTRGMKAVNPSKYNIVLKGQVWTHNVPPCSKGAVCLLANNESVVTWLSPKDEMDNCLTHIPVILFKGKYWTLSLRMSKCIYRHIRLRKGFNNIQNVHGVQTLRIPQLLLNEKKRTQARFEVFEFSRLLTRRDEERSRWVLFSTRYNTALLCTYSVYGLHCLSTYKSLMSVACRKCTLSNVAQSKSPTPSCCTRQNTGASVACCVSTACVCVRSAESAKTMFCISCRQAIEAYLCSGLGSECT